MTSADFDQLGFAAGEVRGTRAWRVDEHGRLRGVTYQSIWRPGENVAQCLRGAPPGKPGHTSATVNGIGGIGGIGGGGAMMAYYGGRSGGVTTSPTTGGTICSCGCGASMAFMKSPFGDDMRCKGVAPDCACGFYGYQEGSNDYYRPTDSGANGTIGGVIRGYGKVLLGTRGFRAEKAEILALYIADVSLDAGNPVLDGLIRKRVKDNYEVPVFDNYLEMLDKFPPDPPEHDDSFWKD